MCSGKTSLTHVSRPVKKLLQNGDADAQLQLGGLGKDFLLIGPSDSTTQLSGVSPPAPEVTTATAHAANSNSRGGAAIGGRPGVGQWRGLAPFSSPTVMRAGRMPDDEGGLKYNLLRRACVALYAIKQ